MRNIVALLVTASALIAVAACNRGEDTASIPDNQSEGADNVANVANVANGTATAEDHAAIMKARHDHFESMGDSMKAIGGQLKASTPSVPIIQQHAATIARFGPQVLTWFPEGSGPESGRKTRAKAEVWSDAATFRQRGQAFEAAANRFNAAAQSGDIDAIRVGQKSLGASCKDCHDRFRAPED